MLMAGVSFRETGCAKKGGGDKTYAKKATPYRDRHARMEEEIVAKTIRR